MKWQIKFYEKENGDIPVLEFIQSLPEKHRAKAIREIDLLEEFGLGLPYPHVDSIKGDKYKGLLELRIRFGSNISRILYFLHIEKTFILLHGFVKKDQKTPTKELEMAKQRMNEYLRR